MKLVLKIFLIVSLVLLTACDGVSDEQVTSKEGSGIDSEALKFTYEEPVIEPIPVEENPEPVFEEEPLSEEVKEILNFDFGETEEIEKRVSVESIRQKRAKGGVMILSSKSRIASENSEFGKPEFRMKDKDYGRDQMAKDLSTLPVERHRTITADKQIPAVLENSINSQIPGRFIAVVENHVFGSDGRAPLLQKGTRIICHYESLAKVGDTRLVASCARAIRPDGLHVLMTGANVADHAGRSGLVGEVDNRNFEKYAGAFGVSLISAATAGVISMDDSTFAKTAAISAALSAGDLSARILDENIDIQPITTIASGSKILIIPETDIWIRKPELKQADENDDNEQHDNHNRKGKKK